MRAILIYLFLLSPLPATFLRPHVGIMLWAWISYMNPHRLTFGSAFDFPFLDIVAPVTLAAWLFSREPKLPPNYPLVWLLAAYLLYTSLTTYFAVDSEVSSIKWLLFVKIMLFTIMTTILINNKVRLDAFLWIVALSVGYFGIKGGLFTVLRGGLNIVWGPPGSFIEDNNQLALALVMTLPLMRYLQLHAPNKFVRWAILGAMGMVLISIFGSQSRGALLAIGAMLLFWIAFSNRRAIGFGLILVATVIGLFFMPAKWTERMETIRDFEQDSSAMGRVQMWRFGMDVANDYPLGGGFDVFYDLDLRARYLGSAQVGRASHSIYFEVLGEHGYGGLFLFLFVGSTGFFMAQRVKSLTRKIKELAWAFDLAAMSQIALGGYAVAGAFLNLGTFDLYWHLLSIIVITFALTERELEARGISLKKAAFALPNARTSSLLPK